MSITLSLIVPFYNEKNIVLNYQKIVNFLKRNYPNSELILVSDGSTKDCVELLEKFIKNDQRTTLIKYTSNRGRGYALKTGFRQAKGKYIAYIDGDLDIKPNYLKKVMAALVNNPVAVISKWHSKSEIKTPRIRRFASFIYNLVIRLVLRSKVKDHMGGLMGFNREVIKSVLNKTKEQRWLYTVELLYLIQKKDYSIIEIPVKISYAFGKKIRKSFIIDFLKVFIAVFQIKWRHRSV